MSSKIEQTLSPLPTAVGHLRLDHLENIELQSRMRNFKDSFQNRLFIQWSTQSDQDVCDANLTTNSLNSYTELATEHDATSF
jgi:hypothetical protein